jgi:glycosyltransferase involved in cell wall biosynthesis
VQKDPLDHKYEISVLVTCYNESSFIVQTLETVVEALKAAELDYEVIVVDDCSQDNSAEIIRNYIETHSGVNVRAFFNGKNRGLANNFVEGAYLGTGKYYRLCCGDNPETLEALTHIFSHLGVADLVIPYQVQRDVRGKSPMRKYLSMLFTRIVNIVSGNSVLYYNSLPIFLRYHVMRYPPISYGFGFQCDIVTRLLDEDITYLQIRHRGAIDRKGKEATALTLRNMLSVVHSLIEITIRRLRREVYMRGKQRAREVRR